MTYEKIEKKEDIVPGYKYVLKIGNYEVRRVSHKSFLSRNPKTTQIWIDAGMLYREVELEYELPITKKH